MKKKKKILAFVLTILIIFVYYCNFFKVFGDEEVPNAVSNYFSHGNTKGQKFSQAIVEMILPAVRITAAGVAVIAITIMGTRYMAAAPTERADIKNQIITFVVGVLLVSGAVKIALYLKQAVQL